MFMTAVHDFFSHYNRNHWISFFFEIISPGGKLKYRGGKVTPGGEKKMVAHTHRHNTEQVPCRRWSMSTIQAFQGGCGTWWGRERKGGENQVEEFGSSIFLPLVMLAVLRDFKKAGSNARSTYPPGGNAPEKWDPEGN